MVRVLLTYRLSSVTCAAAAAVSICERILQFLGFGESRGTFSYNHNNIVTPPITSIQIEGEKQNRR